MSAAAYPAIKCARNSNGGSSIRTHPRHFAFIVIHSLDARKDDPHVAEDTIDSLSHVVRIYFEE